MSTFLEICSDVRAQSGISGNGPASVTGQTGIYADVVRWVEEAYNEIQTLHENWNFLYDEVSITLQGTFSEYSALEEDSLRQIAKDSFTIQYQAEDVERLPYIPFHRYKNIDRYLNTETGEPEVVTEKPNGVLKFWPTPVLDYTIGYEGYSQPDIMEANTDVPIFAAQYHDLIKLKALMKYGEYYNSQEVYKSAAANFNTMLRRMEFSELPKDNIILRPLV